LENRAKIAQRKLVYSKDIDTEIADTQKEADSLEEKLAALKEELERSRVTSPVDGYVTDLSVSTIGGVVTPGMRLMDIIPQDEKLVFETQIPPNLIERVFPGLEARIQLHNFPETPQLNIQGKVLSVSADLVPNKIPNQPPYYLARVEITPDGFIELGNKRLQPGMQAEILIKTGERTFITYLLKPIYRRLSSALKE
jgi:protease secretion system membrane fusion protein